jgi:carbonic anhydrase
MKKVFHFDAPRGKYHCDGAIICCFDNRFDLSLRKFLKRIGIANPDLIKIAGGAQCLASPERQTDREFLVRQIRKSIELHGAPRVLLMVHSDCGGYGGLAERFNGDARAEAEHHGHELRRGAAFVQDAISTVTIEGYFFDFDGVWEVDLGRPMDP